MKPHIVRSPAGQRSFKVKGPLGRSALNCNWTTGIGITRLFTSTARHVQTSMDTTNHDATVQTRKVLFVTNSESGQANTILAMALEATTRPHVQVHIASFSTLRRRIEKLSPKINFHVLDGKDMLETMTARGVSEQTLMHPPTTKSFEPYGRMMAVILTGWDGECMFCLLQLWVVTDACHPFGLAYMRLCDSIKRIIEELNPGVVVIDSLMNAGFDACHSLNQKFVVSSPNTPMDLVREHQPWLKGFWYYPLFVPPTCSPNFRN